MSKTKESIDRAEFLKQLGVSGAALMAMYCLGGVTACTSNKNDPTPTPPTPGTGPAVNVTLALADAANNALNKDGGFIYINNSSIVVARVSATNYVAVSAACTHAGTAVQFRGSTTDFYCPNHGSLFTTAGAVVSGPAPSPLKQYKTEVLNNGASVRVFE